MYAAHVACFHDFKDLGHCWHCLSRLDQQDNSLTMEHVFVDQLVSWKDPQKHQGREKNWAFFEHKGTMLILWKSLPCTIILKVDGPEQGFGLTAVKAICYSNFTSLESISTIGQKAHGSGHPALWEHDGTQEYLFIVHERSKKDDHYVHTILRMNYDTLQITHASEVPLISSRDYNLTGFDSTLLTVFSYHVLPDPAGGQTLAVLFGSGDKYSCSENYRLQDIKWSSFEHVTIEVTPVSEFVMLPRSNSLVA